MDCEIQGEYINGSVIQIYSYQQSIANIIFKPHFKKKKARGHHKRLALFVCLSYHIAFNFREIALLSFSYFD